MSQNEDEHVIYKTSNGDEVITFGKVVRDVYFGSGKDNPPITTRLDRLEDGMDRNNKVISRMEKVEWGIFFALLSAIASIWLKHS